MKKLFLGIALFALNAGGAALAADMPVKARPTPPPAVYSWSGCYFGGFVGYGWGNSQHRSLDPREVPGFFPPGIEVSESNTYRSWATSRRPST
jgi:opacity protein-like surface antigen